MHVIVHVSFVIKHLRLNFVYYVQLSFFLL